MSLDVTPSTATGPAKPQRLQVRRKLQAALDAMVWQGLPFNEAAKAAGLPVPSMRKALGRPHVIAYLRNERQVFRASLVDEATFRMRQLSKQDDNRAAAVTATAKLMNEADEQVSAAAQRHAPGLVVIIQAGPGPVTATTIEHDPTKSEA